MSERIDVIEYQDDKTLFYNGPAEFLVRQVCDELKNVEQWERLFGDRIDPYQRMDYGIRELPALRIYNLESFKEFDSWFITGDLNADIIWPASLRRNELQQIPDTVSAALLQQFRRPQFFSTLCGLVPGLNELGKSFRTNKSMGFEWGEDVVPLTQININFRIDLRQWDLYLEETNRTKDSPFEEVLASLDRIVTVIEGLRDNGDTELNVPLDQDV